MNNSKQGEDPGEAGLGHSPVESTDMCNLNGVSLCHCFTEQGDTTQEHSDSA